MDRRDGGGRRDDRSVAAAARLLRFRGAARQIEVERSVSRNIPQQACVEAALGRIAAGNLSNLKSVGGGVLECRLHFGPGYRIYLGRDGAALFILLAGGTKARQQQDIEKARELWRDYRRRKREEV